MNETSHVVVPAKLSDKEDEEEKMKMILLHEMNSTGEVAVEKSLGLNTQEEAMEFAATVQAADTPHIPQQDNVIIIPSTAVMPEEE